MSTQTLLIFLCLKNSFQSIHFIFKLPTKCEYSFLSLIHKLYVEVKNGLVFRFCVLVSTHFILFQCSCNLLLFQILLANQKLFLVYSSYLFSFQINVSLLIGECYSPFYQEIKHLLLPLFHSDYFSCRRQYFYWKIEGGGVKKNIEFHYCTL